MAKEGWPLGTGVTQQAEQVSQLPDAARMCSHMNAHTKSRCVKLLDLFDRVVLVLNMFLLVKLKLEIVLYSRMIKWF